MSVFEIWLFGYLSIAFSKFVLLLPGAFEQTRFLHSLECVQSNVWLLFAFTIFTNVITSLLWPRVLNEEKYSFFIYQPFDDKAKKEILEKNKKRNS